MLAINSLFYKICSRPNKTKLQVDVVYGPQFVSPEDTKVMGCEAGLEQTLTLGLPLTHWVII